MCVNKESASLAPQLDTLGVLLKIMLKITRQIRIRKNSNSGSPPSLVSQGVPKRGLQHDRQHRPGTLRGGPREHRPQEVTVLGQASQ